MCSDKIEEYREESLFSADNNEELENKITLLAGKINAANYRFLKLIAEFDRREAWGGAGIRSCAHWLNWKCGIAMSAARERVRVARALEGLSGINSAFEKGEISYSKVRAMTRVATDENESFLLMIAEHGTAQHMDKLVKTYQRVSRQDDFEVQEPLDHQEHRELAYYKDVDGMWIIHAKLPADEGGILVKTLDAIVDRSLALEKSEKEAPRETEEKNTSAEVFSKEDSSTSEIRCSVEQRRADALAKLAEHFLARSNTEGGENEISLASLKGAERCQVILHVRSDRYGKDNHITEHVNCDLDGQWVPPDVAKTLACDASFVLVEEDEVGNVLDIGRRSRTISPAMSRALSIRDGCCQFPGCCNSRYVEGHHIKHWADGGETKLDNLVTLCRYHHQELHRGHFHLSLLPIRSTIAQKPQRFADRLVFTKGSNGDVMTANGCKFSSDCCDVSKFENELPADINEETAVTHWTGERMDMGMAMDAMFYPNPRL